MAVFSSKGLKFGVEYGSALDAIDAHPSVGTGCQTDSFRIFGNHHPNA